MRKLALYKSSLASETDAEQLIAASQAEIERTRRQCRLDLEEVTREVEEARRELRVATDQYRQLRREIDRLQPELAEQFAAEDRLLWDAEAHFPGGQLQLLAHEVDAGLNAFGSLGKLEQYARLKVWIGRFRYYQASHDRDAELTEELQALSHRVFHQLKCLSRQYEPGYIEAFRQDFSTDWAAYVAEAQEQLLQAIETGRRNRDAESQSARDRESAERPRIAPPHPAVVGPRRRAAVAGARDRRRAGDPDLPRRAEVAGRPGPPPRRRPRRVPGRPQAGRRGCRDHPSRAAPPRPAVPRAHRAATTAWTPCGATSSGSRPAATRPPARDTLRVSADRRREPNRPDRADGPRPPLRTAALRDSARVPIPDPEELAGDVTMPIRPTACAKVPMGDPQGYLEVVPDLVVEVRTAVTMGRYPGQGPGIPGRRSRRGDRVDPEPRARLPPTSRLDWARTTS